MFLLQCYCYLPLTWLDNEIWNVFTKKKNTYLHFYLNETGVDDIKGSKRFVNPKFFEKKLRCLNKEL